jgi:transposase
MKTMRKLYSADSKIKVAMEAIRGNLTFAELVTKHGVYHAVIGT